MSLFRFFHATVFIYFRDEKIDILGAIFFLNCVKFDALSRGFNEKFENRNFRLRYLRFSKKPISNSKVEKFLKNQIFLTPTEILYFGKLAIFISQTPSRSRDQLSESYLFMSWSIVYKKT